ncbi:hypothetical protein BC826DRAFT_969969 [Russula brevipes]|nr:hypothetical protein BC826DRAFT_969969 [Russula brevipes]
MSVTYESASNPFSATESANGRVRGPIVVGKTSPIPRYTFFYIAVTRGQSDYTRLIRVCATNRARRDIPAELVPCGMVNLDGAISRTHLGRGNDFHTQPVAFEHTVKGRLIADIRTGTAKTRVTGHLKLKKWRKKAYRVYCRGERLFYSETEVKPIALASRNMMCSVKFLDRVRSGTFRYSRSPFGGTRQTAQSGVLSNTRHAAAREGCADLGVSQRFVSGYVSPASRREYCRYAEAGRETNLVLGV